MKPEIEVLGEFGLHGPCDFGVAGKGAQHVQEANCLTHG